MLRQRSGGPVSGESWRVGGVGGAWSRWEGEAGSEGAGKNTAVVRSSVHERLTCFRHIEGIS